MGNDRQRITAVTLFILGVIGYITYNSFPSKMLPILSFKLPQFSKFEDNLNISNAAIGNDKIDFLTTCSKLQQHFKHFSNDENSPLFKNNSKTNFLVHALYYWKIFDCPNLLAIKQSLPMSTISTNNDIDASVYKNSDSESLIRCNKLKNEYSAIPKVSWDSLPESLKVEWNSIFCDSSLTSNTKGKNSNIENDEKRITLSSNNPKSNNLEWCTNTKKEYGVIPQKSWGRLPPSLFDTWKEKRCDLEFSNAHMSSLPLSTCPPELLKDKASVYRDKKYHESLPLIAIMAGSTTRKIQNPSTENIALFNYMLPSLIRTIDCNFRYMYVLGYDAGDPFYDTEEGVTKVQTWFKENIKRPMKNNGIIIILKLVKVNNTLKKPGPVFLEMARVAYNSGANYFYRINDDTEMIHHWPSYFVNTLQHLGPPYGVVGPKCDQGNGKILTHDFVHRLHMEIFELNYYPPKLVDWWMDDWISYVYGQTRTFKAHKAKVIHHTGAHGQRYEVDVNNQKALSQLVIDGRKMIRKWMLTHEATESALKAFDNDEYNPVFSHHDVPTHINHDQTHIVKKNES